MLHRQQTTFVQIQDKPDSIWIMISTRTDYAEEKKPMHRLTMRFLSNIVPHFWAVPAPLALRVKCTKPSTLATAIVPMSRDKEILPHMTTTPLHLHYGLAMQQDPWRTLKRIPSWQILLFHQEGLLTRWYTTTGRALTLCNPVFSEAPS